MKKFEYLILTIPSKGVSEALNKMGEKGWELIQILYATNVVAWTYYFKREKQ